jgi:transposase/Mn-dependent DtxR family transcriptional regulator
MKPLSVAVRSAIVTLDEEGYSKREIGERLKIHFSSVSRILKHYKERKCSSPLPKSGRPTSTTPRMHSRIGRLVTRYPFITSKEVHNSIPELNHLSTSTIRRVIINKCKFTAYRPIKKPATNAIHRKKRLDFCQQTKNWTIGDWSKVMWSDECKVEAIPKSRRYVRRHVGSNPCSSRFIIPTVAHPTSVMIWGCFSPMGTGGLYILPKETTMNAARYKLVLQHHLLPVMPIHHCHLFMHDNAPCHKAKVVSQYLTKKHINPLSWPPNSPDLNPIENLWHILKSELSKFVITNEQQLISTIKEVWVSKILPETCQKLVYSMPTRVASVIKNKGYPINY